MESFKKASIIFKQKKVEGVWLWAFSWMAQGIRETDGTQTMPDTFPYRLPLQNSNCHKRQTSQIETILSFFPNAMKVESSPSTVPSSRSK